MESANRILIVDDDESTRRIMARIFSKKGYDVETAGTGEEGLRKARADAFDGALLDIKLPDMEGVELLRPLRECHPDIVIIMVTAYASVSTAMKALNEGASGYITKPVDMDEVIGSVAGALEKQHLMRENRRLLSEVEKELVERKRTEEALRESEERYRTAIEASSDGVTILRHGKHIYVNHRYAEIFGFASSADLEGTEVSSLIHPEDRSRVTRALARMESGEGLSSRLECKALKGESGPLHIELSATRTHYQGAPVVLSYVRDVTDRFNMEAQLRQMQKMEAMGSLAGGIAHDFNNILSAILGYSEMTELALSQDDPARDMLKEVIHASHRARDLVQQILAFSRQTGQEKRPASIRLIVKEVLKLLRASLPSTIEIRYDITAESDIVIADSTQIHQVLMNLCTNAQHAMGEEGGVLEVLLENETLDADDVAGHPGLRTGSHLVLSVRDSGHGMAPALLERIFDPYFTTKEKGVGTGLGLSVVHSIVKDHGGSIRVESAPGEGSCFRVHLPLASLSVAEQKKPDRDYPTGKGRILFVDDEESIVDLGERMLKHLGYDVETRTSSIEALKTFGAQSGDFDLVITDLTMPGMTGIVLAREIMEMRADIPIILCSGYSEFITEEEARKVGIRSILMKPIVLRELARMVRSLLDEEKGA